MALQRWGDRFGTFDPAAPGQPSGFDSYTWANRPAAASYTGRVIRITDVGPAAGSLFISDGTYWTPLNGVVTLFSGAEMGLSTTSGTLAAPVQLAGWSLTIKAGLFRKPGSYLRGIIKGRRTGTFGSNADAAIKVSWNQTTGVVSGARTGVSSADDLRGIGVVARVNDANVRTARTQGNHGNLGIMSDAESSFLTGFSATADVPLYAYANVSTTPGSGETTWVDSIIVELITP